MTNYQENGLKKEKSRNSSYQDLALLNNSTQYAPIKLHKKDLKKHLKIKSNKQKIKTKKSSSKLQKKHQQQLNFSESNYMKSALQTPQSLIFDSVRAGLKFNYATYFENELANAELIKTKQAAIMNNIKKIINEKRNTIKSLYSTYIGLDSVNKEDLNLKYENFKTILQNYLFNLAKLLIKCILRTIDDKINYQELDQETDCIDEFNYEIMYLINTTNNKSLLFAYTYLVENIDETSTIIPENDYEKQFKNFKKSLKKIYSNFNEDSSKAETSSFRNYNEQQQQFNSYLPYYDEHEDKEFFFPDIQKTSCATTNKILCSVNELKILHFILLLFSKFLNSDVDLTLFNFSLKNVCSRTLSKLDEANSVMTEATANSSSAVVRIACVKIITKLIDQICANKLIKMKILLNASDLD